MRNALDDVMDSIINDAERLARDIAPERDGINITAGGYDYFIHWRRIRSHSALYAWINHLTPKRWWRKDLTPRLIRVVSDHWHWKATVHL
jgi:hypothetical protein